MSRTADTYRAYRRNAVKDPNYQPPARKRYRDRDLTTALRRSDNTPLAKIFDGVKVAGANPLRKLARLVRRKREAHDLGMALPAYLAKRKEDRRDMRRS